jgi:hypothetical protein
MYSNSMRNRIEVVSFSSTLLDQCSHIAMGGTTRNMWSLDCKDFFFILSVFYESLL